MPEQQEGMWRGKDKYPKVTHFSFSGKLLASALLLISKKHFCMLGRDLFSYVDNIII